MRRSKAVIGTLVTALSLFLSVLMAADTAAAQVVPAVERPAPYAERVPSSPAEPTGHPVDDHKLRRGFRNPLTSPAPLAQPFDVCGCDCLRVLPVRTAPLVTGGEAVPLRRSGDLPVLHQVFRC